MPGRRRRVAFRPLALLLLAALALPAVSAAAEPAEDAVRLLVTFAEPVAAPEAAAVVDTASVDPDTAAHSRVQILTFPSASAAHRAADVLSVRDDVLAVEPDRVLTSTGRIDEVLDLTVPIGAATATTGPATQTVGGAEIEVAATSTGTVSDGSWGVRNEGRRVAGVPGAPGVDVGAPMVWDRSTGRDVVVAVIDSGVDFDHPLLQDRRWRNPGEQRSGRDDDGNGYVDDLHGWDFVTSSPQVFHDPQIDAHGTHVAGIIAAAAYPDAGFESVAPDVRIMALRMIGGDGGRVSHAIEAIRYAEANGADVINASWSGDRPSLALEAAIAELSVPFVVAAGNAGNDPGAPVGYPAAHGLDNMLVVGSVDHQGALSGFSSRDREIVDVVAPGERIMSTFPDSRLAIASGTSQAAPHVAGVVALARQLHPMLSAVELVNVVRDSVRPLAAAEETRSGGLVRAPAVLDALGTRIPACEQVDRVPFTDVTPGGAHHDAVACMLALGVTRGTSATTYGAADGLSRVQIATLLANALEPTGQLPRVPEFGRFSDLAGSIHRDNVEVLASLGIVRAAEGDRYDPQRTVTRAEFAAVVTRAAQWLAGADVRAVGPEFADTIGHVEAAGIDAAAGMRIVTGRSPGVFDPDVALRRDQAASMVTRLLDRLVQQGLLAPS